MVESAVSIGLVTSSAQTLKPASVLGPNVLLIGTSVASRPTGDEHAADPRDVVPRVERVPAPVDIGLEPGREIHGTVWRRHADIAAKYPVQ